MTSERRKSIIILALTLVAGILLGLLVPGFFNKWEKRGKFGMRGHDQGVDHKKEMFAGTIKKILRPDSLQAIRIQPILDRAAVQIDSLESSANQSMTMILDSVKSQLTPILTSDQLARLDNYDANARKNWNRGPKHRH